MIGGLEHGIFDQQPVGRILGVGGAQRIIGDCDPLCAEHHPGKAGTSLHGASCHACLFASETSCERGNKYLDRTVLVPEAERMATEDARRVVRDCRRCREDLEAE